MAFIKTHSQKVMTKDLQQILEAAGYVNQIALDKRTDCVSIRIVERKDDETFIEVSYNTLTAFFAFGFYCGAFVQRKQRYPVIE